MKSKIGIAPEMRNRAWRRPKTPPITNAEDTDGIRLRSDSCLPVVVALLEENDEMCSLFPVSGKSIPKIIHLNIYIQVECLERKENMRLLSFLSIM